MNGWKGGVGKQVQVTGSYVDVNEHVLGCSVVLPTRRTKYERRDRYE